MMLPWRPRQATLCVLACFLLILSGCPSPPDDKSGPADGDSGSEATSNEEAKNEESFAPLEPYDPPPLAEIDAEADWFDRPVHIALDLLREKQANEQPLATVQEALAIKNDSTDDNEKILSALGRLYDSPGEANFDTELNRHIPADIKSTNPILSSSTYEGYVIGLTGLGLFSFDWNLEPFAVGEYVVSWQTSKDLLRDKVVIRDDLTWSDGHPVTAHDIVFSFQTIMNPEVNIPAVRTGMDKVRWIEAYDDHTLIYFHKEALATNVWNLNFPIIPKHIYEESMKEDPTLVDSDYHLAQEANPVCGGPYKFVKRIKGQEVVIERRDDWSMHNGKQVREKPHFKRIRFRVIEDSNTAMLALKNGTIEDMEFQPSQWTTQAAGDDYYKTNTKVRGVQWVYYYFGWNMQRPYFRDVRVRKAMSYVVDYDHIIDTLCYGLYERCHGEFYPTSKMAPDVPRTPYVQDFDKAEDLLEEAGWTDSDGDGIRDKTIKGRKVDFEFTVICFNQQLRIDICSSLAESLDRIGVVCHVQPTEFTVMQQLSRDHDFDAAFGGWGTGADPSTLENLWKTGENRNYGVYSNKEVDRLFAEAKYELDNDKRLEYYRNIDGILWEEQPYTWLYFRSAFYGFNRRLRGYMFSPRGPYGYGPGFDSIWAAEQ